MIGALWNPQVELESVTAAVTLQYAALFRDLSPATSVETEPQEQVRTPCQLAGGKSGLHRGWAKSFHSVAALCAEAQWQAQEADGFPGHSHAEDVRWCSARIPAKVRRRSALSNEQPGVLGCTTPTGKGAGKK